MTTHIDRPRLLVLVDELGFWLLIGNRTGPRAIGITWWSPRHGRHLRTIRNRMTPSGVVRLTVGRRTWWPVSRPKTFPPAAPSATPTNPKQKANTP